MAKGITSSLRCNDQIRLPRIRVIDQNNEQLGIIETVEAMRLARDAGLDLVEVAPNERPPVCRIMDYGKYKYQQKKKQKKHHEQQLKEVRIRPKTDAHDREIKVNRAIKFLAKGDKVQFTMVFRGRERANREYALSIFRGILTELGELVKIDRHPAMDGRNMTALVSPIKAAFDKALADGKTGKLQQILDKPDAPDEPDEPDDQEDHENAADHGGEQSASPSAT